MSTPTPDIVEAEAAAGAGPGMRARAALVAELAGGRTVATTLRSDPPLTLRRTPATGPGRPTGLTVHLVGSAAGPVGGDDLGLAVTVGPGARLDIRSVAAALAYPGPRALPSQLATGVEVGPGAALTWRPEPTVLVAGCDHRSTTHITLADGATLVWQEVVVLGRHHEATGSLLQRLRVDVGGRPLLRNDLAVGPRWPASLGPAGVGDAGALGTAVVVDAPPPADGPPEAAGPGGVRAAALRLTDTATLVTALGARAEDVAAALVAVTAPLAGRSCMTRTLGAIVTTRAGATSPGGRVAPLGSAVDAWRAVTRSAGRRWPGR
jgi:urease accessory protein